MIVRAPEGVEIGSCVDVPARVEEARIPVLVGAYGRGNTGKTALLTALVQFCRERGATVQLWNMDQHQRSVSLEALFADARAPEDDDERERGRWLEERLAEQAAARFDAVLDVGGGDVQIRNLAREIDLVQTLEEQGVRPVAFHMVGADPGDLDFLRLVVEEKLFLPRASVVVVNPGRLSSGRSARLLLERLAADPAVRHVVKAGGTARLMPRLACMTGVLERGISFRDAMEGRVKEGQAPLSFFDQERVAKWWTEDMPAFFGRIAAEWLPRQPSGNA